MRHGPNTPEHFRQRLYSRKHTLDQLRMNLMQLPPAQRGEALLEVFTAAAPTADPYGNQQTAGRLLIAVRPQCSQPLEHLLRSVAATWNVSVEELPFYLRDVFGHDAVVEAADRVARDYAAESREADAMATVRWWLSGGSGNAGNAG